MRTKQIDVFGIDLSLRRSAIVFLPADWRPGRWDRVKSQAFETTIDDAKDPTARAQRLVEIAVSLMRFVSGWGKVPIEVFVEDYAYGLAGNAGMGLAELGGAVKCLFRWELALTVRPLNVMTVRKLFLGKLPKKHAQVAVQDALRKMEAPFQGSDEGDAFVVANAGRSELGLVCLTDAGG